MIHGIYGILAAIATGTALILTWRAIKIQPRQGARWFAFMMVGVSWWSLMFFLQIIVYDFEQLRLFFNALHWFGVGSVVIGIFGFSLSVTGREEILTHRKIGLLSIVPAYAVLAWLGDPRVLALFDTTFTAPSAIISLLSGIENSWASLEWIVLLYFYIIVGIGVLILVYSALEGPKTDPDAILLVGMISIPLSVNVLSEVGVIPYPGVDPTIFGFVGMGIIGTIAIDRVPLLDNYIARSTIVEDISIPIFIIGRDYQLQDYNTQAANLLEIKPSELGGDIIDVWTENNLRIPDIDDEKKLTDELDNAQATVPMPEGQSRIYNITVSELESGLNKPVGFALQLNDLTDHYRQRERLEQQNERLDEFAKIVSHDLQNPLHVASGRLELAQSECNSDHLDEVAQAHERMERLIDNLLAHARKDWEVAETKEVALDEIAEKCWSNVLDTDATLNIRTKKRLVADPILLRQLINNIFQNALEHGADKVTITVGNLDDGFYIEDDGSGIPPDKREAIFHTGYSTSEEGTGVGLAIVKQVTDAHGWEICVTDGTEGGARFEIARIDFVAV